MLPVQTFPLRLLIPPPPSEAVTLQCSSGGPITTPIGESAGAERTKPSPRQTLLELLWPERDPGSADASLRPLISRLRHLIDDRLVGRSELHVVLPPGARIDIEIAARYLHDAESAVALGR
jgi:hypothetical protein